MSMKAEEILMDLLTTHFTERNGHLVWNYVEDTSIHEVDEELEARCLEFLRSVDEVSDDR